MEQLPPKQNPVTIKLSAPELTEGTLFVDRYELLEVIGQGGNGIVYKARQLHLQKLYAIKMLSTIEANDKAFARFDREAKALSKLNHENLITAHDFGLSPDLGPYLVMDFVEGESLADLISRTGSLPVQQALRVFIQICQGMSFAHEQGLLHRDLKPSNIMLVGNPNGDRIVKIVDFGIAKSLDENLNLTKTGDVVGSPLYMSPEQSKGHAPDARSDVYSVGVLMYETLTGHPPFTGLNSLEVLYKHISEVPRSLDSYGKKPFPVPLVKIVEAALNKDPELRIQSMAELKEKLQEVDRLYEKPATRALLHLAFAQENHLARNLALAVTIAVVALVLTAFIYNLDLKPHEKAAVVPTITASSSLNTAEIESVAQDRIATTDREHSPQLDFENSQVNDSELMHQTLPPQVNSIVFRKCNVTDEGITNLFRGGIPPRLGNIDVCDTKVGDKSLARFAQIPSLISLALNKSRVSDQGLKSISSLPQLLLLYIDYDGITNQGVAEVAKLKTLIQLSLVGDPVDDDGVFLLKDLVNLQCLYIEDTKITNKSMRLISKFKLRVLNLSRTAITDSGIALLRNTKTLRKLNVSNTNITDRSMPTLTTLELEELNLSGTKITNSSLDELAKCKFLKRLDISNCPKLTQTQIERLKAKLSHCDNFKP